MNMNTVIKNLEANNISYKIRKDIFAQSETIEIPIEKNLIWVNGVGEEEPYDRVVRIYRNTYRQILVKEKVTSAHWDTHIKTTKQKEVVAVLNKLLGISN